MLESLFTVAYYCYFISEVTKAAYFSEDEAVNPISHLRSSCVRLLVITDYRKLKTYDIGFEIFNDEFRWPPVA